MRPLFVLLALGCAHPYVEPALNEPHAVVEVHIVHRATLGPRFAFALDLGGESVQMGATAQRADTPITRSLRVRPGPASWHFASRFTHLQTSTHLVTDWIYESYPCGTMMSFGLGRGYPQTRYCQRSVPRQRWVTETVPIVDGACDTGAMLDPVPGESYVLQYEFISHGQCEARCFRQMRRGSSTPDLVPCGRAVPSSGGETPITGSPGSPANRLGNPSATVPSQ
jgi:hypothetical protein